MSFWIAIEDILPPPWLYSSWRTSATSVRFRNKKLFSRGGVVSITPNP